MPSSVSVALSKSGNISRVILFSSKDFAYLNVKYGKQTYIAIEEQKRVRDFLSLNPGTYFADMPLGIPAETKKPCHFATSIEHDLNAP